MVQTSFNLYSKPVFLTYDLFRLRQRLAHRREVQTLENEDTRLWDQLSTFCGGTAVSSDCACRSDDVDDVLLKPLTDDTAAVGRWQLPPVISQLWSELVVDSWSDIPAATCRKQTG